MGMYEIISHEVTIPPVLLAEHRADDLQAFKTNVRKTLAPVVMEKVMEFGGKVEMAVSETIWDRQATKLNYTFKIYRVQVEILKLF